MGIRLTIRSLLLLLLLLFLLPLVGLGPAGATAQPKTVTVRVTLNGLLGVDILIDSGGFPLYHDLLEKKGEIHCVASCTEYWRPLLVDRGAKLLAGPGVKASELATVKRPNGDIQVTYHGLALYLFVGDTLPGQALGQGAHGVWFAVTPEGAVTTAGTSGPARNDGGAGPGYGY